MTSSQAPTGYATGIGTVLIVISDAQASAFVEKALSSVGWSVNVCNDQQSALNATRLQRPAIIVCGERFDGTPGMDFAARIAAEAPAVPVIYLADNETNPAVFQQAMRSGFSECLFRPLRADEVRMAVQFHAERGQRRREATLLEGKRFTTSLQNRVAELETLQRLGNTITSSLDLDSVLTAIVDAAVELTGAEEGSLMLLDDATGELYMRASRNFQEEFVRTFRLPVQDSSIGSVLSSGQPLLIDEQSLQKIKTSYLVHGLVYVPLKLGSSVIGVLGVSNRTERRSFKDHDLTLLSAMGEYAVIAIHNAGLYSATTAERNKLETILTRVEDGVVVLDQESRLVLVNSVARSAFGLDNKDLIGERFEDHFKDEEMTRLVEMAGASLSNRMEVTVADGRVFSGHLTPIPDVGMTITLHDITYLKQLDKIKSDFVGTVSHDLRSPLTAIMGYVELIERAGPVNERQVDFIRRVHQNVQNITRLIDDLLHLGQIESGLDLTKERIPVGQLIKIILDEYQSRLTGKNLTIECSLPDSALYLIGNPVQMRQMFEKLLDNAVKYSMTGGHIDILGAVEQNQVILQVRDSGVGIPSVDMPFIFDKFYRGSNVAGEVQGTGLGLAIVKSIVESHKGRIWVDSTLGEGATFTIVMPVAEG